MKKLLSIFIFSCLFISSNYGQSKDQNNFTQRMNDHITRYLSDDTNMAKAKELYGHTCDKHHVVTEEEIKAAAAEAEKHAFIQANMDEYMKIYFPQTASRSVTTDTFICDNGGFENDFLFYKGYISTYTSGSNTCTPNVPGWTPVTLPLNRRFQIVNSGIDPLVGINKTKFGSKALKLNSEFGHINTCDGNLGVDKLVKRFKVTEDNLDFTVWYATVLENPSGHVNQQPFFSIKCDLAPGSDLCFDADILKCEKLYPSGCGYDSIDVLNWACHRIKIPSTQIGNIATLEITMADCGLSAHFGYAYIDGICEECTGSSLGSGTFYDQPFDGEIGIDAGGRCSPGKDTIITICGRYTLPSICNDFWMLDSIVLQNFPNIPITIDTTTKTFCFEFPLSLFVNADCIDLVAELYFITPTNAVPVQFTNTLELCTQYYHDYSYQSYVGTCYDNGTPDDLSDDYYFVDLVLLNTFNEPWSIDRQLLDPYPNESGLQTIATGSGDTNIQLGPFLIQEGCWDLIINLPYCTFYDNICPPDFCSSCPQFNGLEISNVQCQDGNPDDTWSFDINIPGNGIYYLSGPGATNPSYNFGQSYPITVGIISGCINYSLVYLNGTTNEECKVSFWVCPPKPCGSPCPFEVKMVNRVCDKTGNTYTAEFEFEHIGNNTVCYMTNQANSTISPVPNNGILGPFSTNDDVEITFYVCSGSNCTMCNPSDCFKTIKVFAPDCNSGHFNIGGLPRITQVEINELKQNKLTIIPNPAQNNEVTILSPENKTFIEIFNSEGRIIKTHNFYGSESKMDVHLFSPGLYIVRYHFGDKQYKNTKLIKL
ncbi:MAG TPA: T9SS type A sorting domain-containing protein [Saprospiraceae bacterium]|jgi:hypothetical protein|nr:T9SS type A sorting domain-containing protein [Saprospiraceae bacterium]HMT71922.1 T9SS type A sorting domain-containing protein [Saprospiraceae bacterium]